MEGAGHGQRDLRGRYGCEADGIFTDQTTGSPAQIAVRDPSIFAVRLAP
ncbi:MAG: hypothetical protein M3527_10065 [Actinomycetota bacterium]|nr:hypothetical protein [Acidimicrobiia bacterium]MDQ3294775.1 hypothetical protein [Actinomycetota bacterium]